MAPNFQTAIVAIIKNEAIYLEEWINYHRLIGFEHFFIFDNNSTDASRRVLSKYVKYGLVTVIDWPMHPGQIKAYNFAIKSFGHLCKWMALLDVDEFVSISSGKKIDEFLIDFEPFDQILLPFMFFGSSGHVMRPPGPVIKNFVHRAPEVDGVVKCIVKPESVVFADVHQCFTIHGKTVNELREAIPERFKQQSPSGIHIRINHYYTKSKEEWIAKLRRGQDDDLVKTLALFDKMDFKVEDRGMNVFVEPTLREIEKVSCLPEEPVGFAPLSCLSRMSFTRGWFTAAHKALLNCRESTRCIAAETFSVVSFDLTMDRAVLVAKPVNGIHFKALLSPIEEQFDKAARLVTAELLPCETRSVEQQAIELAPKTEIRQFAPDDSHKIKLSTNAPHCEAARYFLNLCIMSEDVKTIRVELNGLDPGRKPSKLERHLTFPPGLVIASILVSEVSQSNETFDIHFEDVSAPLALGVLQCWAFL